jgi:hypothetical protein
MRVKQGTTEEKQGAVLFCIGLLFFTQRIRLGRMMLFPRYLHCLPPLFTAL